MEEVVINDDEMMGFIMRQVGIEGVSMSYRDIDLILSAQMKFLREKGLVVEVDEIQTKDSVVSDESYEVTIKSLTIDRYPIFLDGELRCLITNPGKLMIKGPMEDALYDTFKQRVLKGSKHTYTVTLSNGRVSNGYLAFSSCERQKESKQVEITAETTE